ncbi:MAG: hypothetical protein J0H57_03580, partial [Rhodospirillales bacterium]|nr:hypothetical protein [Rhodospirillales bacterium]
MSVSRRRFLLGAATLPLAGCGFQPVYMPTASGKPGPAERELSAINVGIIPDRSGQLLRQALQARLADDGGTPQLYDLAVSFGIIGDSIGILQNNLATRVRLIGSANYVLTTRTTPPVRLTGGSARTVDAYNLFDQQLFAADMEDESVRRRSAETLAEQIANQLAIFFRKRAAG